MGTVAVVGVDLAKSVLQVHGIDESGAVVLQHRVSRRQFLKLFEKLPPCLKCPDHLGYAGFGRVLPRGAGSLRDASEGAIEVGKGVSELPQQAG